MTRTVFADSGYWIALLNPRDDLHLKAKEVSESLGHARVVTSEMVLAELLGALRKPGLREIAAETAAKLMTNPNADVIPQTSVLFRQALTKYRAHRDKEWSLTDCASFLVMEQKGIREALAHDHHFEQAGFQALLRA